MDQDFKITRRGFVSGILTVCATSFIGCATSVIAKARDVASRVPMPDFGPINRGKLAAKIFSGDNPEKAHQILWNLKNRTKASFVASLERKRLVVVGGGMSGLISAYLLKAYSPVVLEQAERLGGNSKGENLAGIDYSIGAAYINRPDLDSQTGKLLLELGLFGKWRERTEEDPVELSGRKIAALWEEGKEENALKLKEYFETLYKTADAVPEIPFRDAAQKDLVTRLDKKSLLTHLQGQISGEIPTSILTYLENYCRSSFGTAASETSAAAALNFLSGEFNPICSFPGGNSAISEKLSEKLFESLPENSLRVSSLVTKVKVVADGVEVTYVDSNSNTKKILADSVVMSCPKFVVKRILDGIEPKREAAIDEMEYRAYVVGNILVNKNISKDFYDLFFLSQKEQGLVTDVIYGGQSADGEKTLLTLYAPLAYSGGRTQLFSENFETVKKKMEAQLENTILPFFKLKKSDIEELRLTRWGHPMPAAKPGFISSDTLALVRAPFKDRVFFVEQDNWCLPAFETCVSEAYAAAPKISAFLSSKLAFRS